MHVYKVASLVDAVEMAARFRRKGTYDWFRGQTRNWKPIPTMVRLTKSERKVALERLKRFCYWLIKTPGLASLRKDPTDGIAIAQHYGLPTPFLDFTTNPGVAGYFACTEKPSKTEPACIYCLNTRDLLEIWGMMRKVLPHYPELKLIKVKVPNLWRLEAQQGVFVDCLTNWTAQYPMDRIEFPASRPPPFPTKDQIYPARKSQLEMLLDHYLEAEAISEFGELMKKEFPDALVTEVCGPKDGYFAEYFGEHGLPPLPDWGKTRLKKWQKVPAEDYRKTATGEIPLRLKLKAEAKELGDAAAYGVRRALETDPKLRKQAVRWVLQPSGQLPRKLTAALEKLWNGVRRQPYSNDQIAAAVGFCFRLFRSGFMDTDRPEERKTVFETCAGLSIRVEFSSWEGNPVRAFVAIDSLLLAVRPDIADYLLPKYRQHAGQIAPLLQFCSNQRRLFRFERFADFFIRKRRFGCLVDTGSPS
jgi:hypothetical protein